MTRRKKSNGGKILGIDFKIVFIMMLLVVMVLAFYYLGTDLGFEFDPLNPVTVSQFLAVLPSIFFFIIGLYIIVNIGGLYVIPAFGVLGFGLAVLLKAMYDPPLSMITPNMMSGLSIQSIMLWTVVISLLFGGIIGAATSKRKR